MKKVLLTTTALVMTAGVASAEITFSGKGEAGFYRTAKVKAAAAKVKASTFTQTVTSNQTTAAAEDGVSIVLADSTTAATQTLIDHASSVGSAAAVTAAAKALKEAIEGGATDAQIAQAAYDLEVAQLSFDAIGTAAVAAAKAGDMTAYSGYDFNVAASGASDNGMTFAMGFDMGAGSIADQDDDRAMDAQAGAIATSAMTIGYNGYTIEIGDDKIDDLYDDTQNGDVSLAGSFGDLTFKLVTDMQKDVKEVAATKNQYSLAGSSTTANDAITKANITGYTAGTAKVAAVYNPTSYSVGYSMGDMSFSMAGTEHDDYGNAAAKYSLTYKVLPSLSATLSSDNVGTYKDIGKLSATYTLSDAMSITASVKDDKDHALNTNTGGKQSQDFSIAYSAGVLSATIATDESSNWWVNAKYDLGGGAQAFTTFDHTEFLVAGVNFAF